jgi:hypothetical protein
MLKLHKDLSKAKTPHEQESLQRQILPMNEAHATSQAQLR